MGNVTKIDTINAFLSIFNKLSNENNDNVNDIQTISTTQAIDDKTIVNQILQKNEIDVKWLSLPLKPIDDDIESNKWYLIKSVVLNKMNGKINSVILQRLPNGTDIPTTLDKLKEIIDYNNKLFEKNEDKNKEDKNKFIYYSVGDVMGIRRNTKRSTDVMPLIYSEEVKEWLLKITGLSREDMLNRFYRSQKIGYFETPERVIDDQLYNAIVNIYETHKLANGLTYKQQRIIYDTENRISYIFKKTKKRISKWAALSSYINTSISIENERPRDKLRYMLKIIFNNGDAQLVYKNGIHYYNSNDNAIKTFSQLNLPNSKNI